MPLPTVIHSQVDPAAITKVTRLFNNTLSDSLTELVQNARRAGASLIELTTSDRDGQTWLTVTDDGGGIADPSVVLSLGRSDWDKTIAQREDPAGMGVFSLAGRHVVIASRPRAAVQGWRIEIGPDDWESGAPIPVQPCEHGPGTSVRLPIDTDWADKFLQVANGVARYCPVPIRCNGALLPQQDWLADAAAVFEQDGVRIGIFDGQRSPGYMPRVNFHGLTVTCFLPAVDEKDRHWWARVDIVDAPDLQLVLPARKEMVENQALADLRQTVKRAIFRHIESLGSHSLPYAQWCEARDLGITLPEARQQLRAWIPSQADANGSSRCAGSLGERPILVGDFGAPIEQCADHALAKDGRFASRLAGPDDAMAGYSWYDALSRVTDLRFEIEIDGVEHRFDANELPDVATGIADRIDLVLEIAGAEAGKFTIPAPVAILYDECTHCTFEEAAIVLGSADAVTPAELVELLEGSCFCSSDDRDADSWDTQNSRFLLDAQEMATRLLLGDDAALIERVRAIVSYRVQWFVPEGRQFSIVIGRNALDVQITPPADAA